jgi:hypothetical protein
LVDGNASTNTGTPDFKAPEVLFYKGYDARADICSLGLTLYYLLNNNTLPFGGAEDSLTRRIMKGEAPPPLPPSVPPPLDAVVRKACAFDPNNRYANAAALRAALENSAGTVSSFPDGSEDFAYASVISSVAGSAANLSSAVTAPAVTSSAVSSPVNYAVEAAVDSGGTAIVAAILRGKKKNLLFGGYYWQVMETQKDKVLLVAEKFTEKRPYNTDCVPCTWETCTLRQYLNGEFYNKFGTAHKALILTAELPNQVSAKPKPKGGKNTNDKIFLLSVDEAKKYFSDDSARILKGGWWWLRSPGSGGDRAAYVDGKGGAEGNSLDVTSSGGVRPALWLSLK